MKSKFNSGFSLHLVITTLLALLLLAGLGYAAYNSLQNKQEKDISDIPVIEKLGKKVQAISALRNTSMKDFYIDGLYTADKTINISDAVKTELALRSLYNDNKFTEVTIPRNDIKISNMDLVDNLVGGNGMVSLSKVEDVYSSLFGSSLQTKTDFGSSCPGFYYDSENEVYYSISDCGGLGVNKNYAYNYKYSQKGDEYYVYTSVGYDNSGSEDAIVVYTNYDGTAQLSTSESKDFSGINSDNYKEFSKFKYTFKKTTAGDYYFYSVEKVN